MPFYRPKSFLKLVLIGFALVMLPLIIAVIDAAIRVDRIAEQSQRTVSRAVQVLQGSRTLAVQATDMERYVKQFQVLGDESLFHAYVETHDRFQQVAHNLVAIIRDAAQEQQLAALTTKEQSLFEAVQTHLRSGHRPASLRVAGGGADLWCSGLLGHFCGADLTSHSPN